LEFNEVFTKNDAGGWDGFVRVVFVAPNDPYTAFDYVELSLFDVEIAGFLVRTRGTTKNLPSESLYPHHSEYASATHQSGEQRSIFST